MGAVPSEFSFSVYSGIPKPHSWSVVMRDGRLWVTEGFPEYFGGPSVAAVPSDPTETDWARFRQSLESIGVLDWAPEYDNPGVLDGGGWSLEVVWDDLNVSTGGFNGYPDADGFMDWKPTKPWRSLASAVKQLSRSSAG